MRSFDGSGDRIVCSLGAGGIAPATLTMAAICSVAGDGTDLPILTGESTGPSHKWGLWRASDNSVQAAVNTDGTSGGPSFQTTDGICLVAANRPNTSTAWRLHKIPIATGTRTSANGSGGGSTGSAPNSAIRIGDYEASISFNGSIAVAAAWDRSLSDAEIENLASSLTAWHASNPKLLYVLDQATTGQAVADLTGGGANQTSTTGNAVAATSLPVFNYGAPVILVTRQPAAGGATVTGAATAAFTITPASSGVRTRLGASASSIAVTTASAGVRTRLGASASALSFSFATAATRTAIGASTAALGFSASTTAFVGRFGAATAALTITPASSGVRTRLGASTAALVMSTATSGVRTTFGSSTAALVFQITTAVGATLGAAAASFAFNVATAATRTTFGASATPVIIAPASSGVRKTFGAATASQVFAVVSSGRVTVFGVASVPIVFQIASASYEHGDPATVTGSAISRFGATGTRSGRVVVVGTSSATTEVE